MREPSLSEVRVRYFETDRMGGAYHAHYLVWFEVARTDYIRAAGSTYRELEEEGFILPVLEVYCRYRRAARYDERIRVEARCERYRRARIRFLYRAVGEDDAVVAEGWTIHAVTDPKGAPLPLPASLLDRLFPPGSGPSS